MTKILIPRSDSISAKIIEPSDFEKFYTDDIIPDYKKSGFTLTAGSGLAVNVSSGVVRLKGLYLENSASETVSSLTASDVNYIYVKLARDQASEAESWDFFKNLTGTTPTDAFFIGTATTNGSAVTAVDQGTVTDIAIPKLEFLYFGDGVDGDVTLSTNTSIDEVKHYENLTINSGVTLTSTAASQACLIVKVKGTLTINGTINMDAKGGAAGAGRTGGTAGESAQPNIYGMGDSGFNGYNNANLNVGKPGQVGDVGGLGQIGNADTQRQEDGSGGSGAGGTGGAMNAGWAGSIFTVGQRNAQNGGAYGNDGNVTSYYGDAGTGHGGFREFMTVLGANGKGQATSLIPHFRPGLANVPNIRLNDPFYIAVNMPQLFGGGGSGGTSGTGGQGGGITGGTANAPNGGVGGDSGAGGAGGGGIILMAKNIVIGASGVLTADGANGTNGTIGGVGTGPTQYVAASVGGGSGGGGGGGEAGQIVILYESYINNGSSNITMTGGTGGTGAAAPTLGYASGAGGNGSAKTLKQVNLSL